MRFHAMLPVRDEGDIVEQCLSHLLTWADHIYVFDTGSVDDTWDIVRNMADREKRIVPLRRDPVYFNDSLVRGWLFHHVRPRMRNGDWFLRVDADEFYEIPPPDFVRSHMRKHETLAVHQKFDFYLTQSEVAAWDAGLETLQDRSRPIEQRRRWFLPMEYSEPRLCRYRDTMRWPSSASFPYNAGYVARERLPLRHYPRRDPVQLQRRYLLRSAMMADSQNRADWGSGAVTHWYEMDWRRDVVPDDLPGLLRWQPGEPLPQTDSTSHLASMPKRMAQRLIHALALPFLDPRRPGWQEGTYPARIPPRVVAELERQLAVPA